MFSHVNDMLMIVDDMNLPTGCKGLQDSGIYCFCEFTMRLNCKLFSFSKLHWDWAIKKLHGSHHCWMSWPALDKGNLLQPSSASTRESENSWPGLWLSCLLSRLTWVAAENMRLSTQSVRGFVVNDHWISTCNVVKTSKNCVYAKFYQSHCVHHLLDS